MARVEKTVHDSLGISDEVTAVVTHAKVDASTSWRVVDTGVEPHPMMIVVITTEDGRRTLVSSSVVVVATQDAIVAEYSRNAVLVPYYDDDARPAAIALAERIAAMLNEPAWAGAPRPTG